MMKVCKFGGSSVADAETVAHVCDIILADPDRRIVVVSAPGKRDAADTKVTDMLIACAEQALAGAPTEEHIHHITERFRNIQVGLEVPEDIAAVVHADLQARVAQVDKMPAAMFMDLMKAGGEDNSAKVIAAVLRHRGAAARYVNPGEAGLLLTADFGDAQLIPSSYDQLASLGEGDEIVVFPGFFGQTPDGDIATFPRGGSDITGAILAAAVKADSYENFTDVDSVFAADPRIVPNAKAIHELSFREMRELAYAGFSIIHDEAIIPAVHAGIPIYVKNTHSPDSPGTRIVPQRDASTSHVVGIASSAGFCTISVRKVLMNREIGFGRRLLQIFEDENISYEHTPSGIDDMSIVLKEKNFDSDREAQVLARIRQDLDVDDVSVERGLALLMIVGEGMQYAVGMAATATAALANAKVNIEMMNQGSSEISMMFGVKAEARERAVRSLYQAFFEPSE